MKKHWLAFALVLIANVLGNPVTASSDLCGVTIFENLELDHDLVCSGDGLLIGADGITVRLNGHTIAGSNTGAGIVVAGRTNIRIAGGTIRNFQTGIRLNNSSRVLIYENNISSNTMDGVDLQAGSVENTVKENEIRDNFSRGIMLRGDANRNTVKENVFIGNNVGILLFQPIGSIVKENVVAESRTAGIRVRFTATGNVIKENQVVSNPAGIEFLVSPTGSPASGNSVIENALATNACGLKGPVTGNTVTENRFQGNDADTCQ